MTEVRDYYYGYRSVLTEEERAAIDITDKAAWAKAEAELAEARQRSNARTHVNFKPNETIELELRRAREKAEMFRFFWIDRKAKIVERSHSQRLKELNARHRTFYERTK